MTLRILIVDDDDVDRMAARRSLAKSTHDELLFAEAATSEAAMEILKAEAFDVILLDYLLPDGDGLALLKLIRGENIRTPVIVLTGHGDEKIAVLLMQAGATDYIPKNQLAGDDLYHHITNAVRLSQAEEEKHRAQNALHQSNQQIVNILESISDAFFALDHRMSITHANTRAETLLMKPLTELAGRNVLSALPELAPWFKDALKFAEQHKKHIECEGIYAPSNRWLTAQIYPTPEGLSVYVRDVTERKRNEERLNYLANYDSLTGLPNRLLLIDRLQQALTRAPWHKRRVAVLFIDLDRFKIVNDNLGHLAGDDLLKVIGVRIERCLRNGDTVARIGGDEFMVVLADLAPNDNTTMICDKLIKTINQPIVFGNQELYVTASIGVSIYPDDGEDGGMLMRNADIAMYTAKEKGKNCYHFFSKELGERNQNRLVLESDIRKSLSDNQLTVFYQPIVERKTKRIIGAEALVRWPHPQKGIVFPSEFLPIAEESGLTAPIDRYVLAAACRQTKRWHDAGYRLSISVNVSNSQFRTSDFLDSTLAIVRETGLDPRALQLELTENIVMTNVANTAIVLRQLDELGIRLAVDDFGTGYSSLAHLKHLPLSTLKIDRSYIQHVNTSRDDAVIVEAIAGLGQKLGISITAEGVETQAQEDFLVGIECDYLQGYYYGKPMTADDFSNVLKQQDPSAPHAGAKSANEKKPNEVT